MTEIVSLKQEHQTATSLYGQTEHLTELFQAVRKVAPWANDNKQPMTDMEVALVVRKAVAMGLDPLNGHEVQIWKDNRGSVNFQIGYPLMIEFVRHFHGEHTEPQYTRLTPEELHAEGLQPADVAYRVSFLMKKDIEGLKMLIDAGYPPEEARKMIEVSGLGASIAAEYNGAYFAPNARSKSWKVQKRALMDAYRHKFGTPNRAQIEELRRVGGFDNLRPGDWEDTEGLSPNDAQALAESAAKRREHEEALENDPEYRKEHEKKVAEAAASLWPETSRPPEAPPASDFDAEADAAMVAELKAQADAEAERTGAEVYDVPADLPQKWPQYHKRVQGDMPYYTSMQHIQATIKKELGEDYQIFETSGPNAGSVIEPARLWVILRNHAEKKALTEGDGLPF